MTFTPISLEAYGLKNKINLIMFKKLPLFCIAFTTIVLVSISSSAKSVYPVVNKKHSVVVDKRGNCVRSQWVADQCCDPCGFELPTVEAPAPAEPVAKYIMKEKVVTYVDLIRQSIYFEIDKHNIDADDRARMDEVIQEIQKSDGVKAVRLVGYADRYASDEYNVNLSRNRAKNALSYFQSRGYFVTEKVDFAFMGENRPVTSCPTTLPRDAQVACLQADRRVDIEVEVLNNRIDTVKELVYVDPQGNIINVDEDNSLKGYQYQAPEGVVFEDLNSLNK